MEVEALRGVCIGVERHLVPPERAEVDDSLGRFLLSIGAVRVVEPAPVVAKEPAPQPQAPVKGKKE